MAQQQLPQWATPERRAHMVALFERSRGFCVFGYVRCLYQEHHYEEFLEGAIEDWKALDRDGRCYERRLEEERRHVTTEPWGRPRSRYDTVAREKALLEEPEYHLEGVWYDALKREPVARVRVAGTPVRLFVGLPHKVQKLRFWKKREAIERLCRAAVLDWRRQHGLA